MRRPLPLVIATLLASAASATVGAELRSAAPADVSVTVYRAPDREGRLALDDLRGFALITETRRVTLPAGESTLRFEGVAGGIQAESAIVTGLPDGVVEKNRDATLLSPATLVAASLKKGVVLERTNPKTGKLTRTRGTIESDADGVVFRGPDGFEALRCSGLPETFSFEPFAGAHAVPTLSVRVRSDAPITRTVTLSYLASGFDWSATYTATLAPGGKTLDLGAWVTLANGNGETFREAQTQVVAGRLNHEEADSPPEASDGPIVAQCWPRGSTSDVDVATASSSRRADAAEPQMMMMRSVAAPAAAFQQITVTAAKKVTQEQLGDLKLYRVPDRTTVAALQMKQVRLMDQLAVPVHEIYEVNVPDEDGDDGGPVPIQRQLRTRNTRANHLGLPLPAGSVAVYAPGGRGDAPLLVAQSDLRDHAVDEEVHIGLGAPPDVEATVTTETRAVESSTPLVPLLPGIALRSVARQVTRRLEIISALPHEADVEVRLELGPDARMVRADRPVQRKDGQPTILVRVAARSHTVLRYATAATADIIVRPR